MRGFGVLVNMSCLWGVFECLAHAAKGDCEEWAICGERSFGVSLVCSRIQPRLCKSGSHAAKARDAEDPSYCLFSFGVFGWIMGVYIPLIVTVFVLVRVSALAKVVCLHSLRLAGICKSG